MRRIELPTPYGLARAHLDIAKEPRAALVLGHGAAGGIEAPDLAAAREAARSEGISVVLVEQPYRVAGRRAPAPAAQLDAAWTTVVESLRGDELGELPLIVGGRSLGARVACRTAEATGAVAVLCLAFPLQPPRRAGKPPQSRLSELEAVTLPTLVVQGERDPFGIPPPGPSREVVTVPGDHGLKADPEAVSTAVRGWLSRILTSDSSQRLGRREAGGAQRGHEAGDRADRERGGEASARRNRPGERQCCCGSSSRLGVTKKCLQE